MYGEIKNGISYNKTLIFFSFVTLICGGIYAFIGQIALPVLTSFCAALFLLENPQKRYLSILIPAAIIIINFLINGIYFVVSFEFVILSVILAVIYKKGASKAFAVAFMTVISFVFSIIYLYFYPFDSVGSLNPAAIIEFYSNLISEFKQEFVATLSSFAVQNENGVSEYLMSADEAEAIFSLVINMTVGFIASIAFIISGLTLKLFVNLVGKRSENGISKGFETFMPSTVVSVFFIILCLFNVFSQGETVLEIAMANLGIVFSLSYAYIGLKCIFEFMEMMNRKSIFWIMLIVGIVITGSTIIQLLSYVGVYFALIISKNKIHHLGNK